jgi:superfamily I DNA and/or RNA helicase
MTQNGYTSPQKTYIPPMTRRIEDWKSRLIDLSRRNNLLYYKPSKRGSLSISRPTPETIFNGLVVRKRHLRFWFPPEETGNFQNGSQVNMDLSTPFEKERSATNRLVCEGISRIDLEKTLKNLMRRSLSDYREKGVRILHAVFGMLVWKEKETSEEIRSPLILVPIELERKSFREPFSISVPPVEEEAVLNPALQVKLKSDLRIELPPLPEYWERQSLTDYFNALTQITDELGWKVEITTEIGLFSFHKLVIYNDLTTNAELIKQHPIIRAIAGVKTKQLTKESLPEEKDVDKIEPPEKTFQVLDADSSQRISIEYALRGQSFVMQGPPGTGKSQTIANIISECIAQGKSVLFVSDKMAALEVVYKRLREVGLAHFCLELHSSKANKQEVVAELKRCLDEQLVPRKLPSPHEFEKMTAMRENLSGYVVALHQRRPYLQKSAYEVLGQISSLEGVPFIPVELPNPGSLTPQRMQELENLMNQLKNVWQVVEETDFPWRDYRGNSYDLEVRSELSTVLDDLSSIVDSLRRESEKFADQLGLSEPSAFDQVKWLIDISKLQMESPKPEASWVTHPNLGQLISEAKTYQSITEWCKTTRARLLERYKPSIFTLVLSMSLELEDALATINKSLLNSHLDESELLKKREQLLEFVRDIQVLTKKWSENSQTLAQMLELPTENITPNRVRKLSRLALLCFQEDKPEPKWLDPAYFQLVKEAFAKAKKDYEEYNALKAKLGKTYKQRIFELDLDEFVRRYRDRYKSSLRWLRPSFYSDQKQIALATHDGKVPESVLNDLLDARRLKALSDEIEASTESVRSLLGHFYQGYDTDFQRIEKAIQNTIEFHRLMGAAAVPETLAKLVTNGSEPEIVINRIGSELQESLDRWDQLAKELNDLLPINSLPNSSLSVYETPLVLLQEWAKITEKQLNPLLEKTKETLETCKAEEPQNYKQLIEDLKDAENVRKKETEILEDSALLQKKFGFRFAELNTNWEEILSILHWTQELRALFGAVAIPETFAILVSRGPEHVLSNSELIRHCDAALKALAGLESRFETALTYRNQKLQEMSLESIHDRVKELRERVDDLQVWIDFKNIKDQFSLRGLNAFFERLTEEQPPVAQLVDVFRRGAYQEWINNLCDEDSNLGRFRRENHEQLIEEFRKLDQELIRLSSSRVIESANTRKPQDILIQANDSEVNTLLREAAKKRRLLPIRTLLQRIPHILFRIKPCLLMSPISVSQFLTPELMQFDLILFDEASQIVPEDAIGPIYRGKTIVVAGDNKQLPPTSFFQKSMLEDIDWDEISDEDAEVFDSILDECMGIGLPVKTLRWHYRSKHEELIAFSNHNFYDDTLITFPSPMAQHESLGVKMVHVPDGIYDRGGRRDNLREAEVVADLVFEHFRLYPKKTLGVVTFSIAQMEAVEDAIDSRLRLHPEFEHFFKEDRLEGFFVKNLENVQGDERDVIIISVGYGRDPQGLMTMNFGPVNKSGGERRLNVAVTRAREKTVVVASIKASDIDAESANTVGVVALRNYLEYAEKGPEALNLVHRKSGELESPLEEDVAMAIQRMGYSVVPKVGWSGCPIDIGVADPHSPGCYLLGVEFDGLTYRSINSARDRDRLREQVLRQLGWRIHRVWSPAWVARRESEIRRLADVLEEAHKSQLEKEVPSEEADSQENEDENDMLEVVDVQRVQFAGAEKIGVPYRVHPLKARLSPSMVAPVSRYRWTNKANEFYFQENRQLQSHLLEELVNEEGPIHFDYAVQRLASAWGLKRTGPKVVLAVREALNLLLIDRKVTVKGRFLWPTDLQDAPVRVPVPGVPESKRIPEYIPPEEIENAMKLLAKYALGISAESLIVETARVFGFNRTGENIRDKIYDVYKRLLWERKLICTNGVVTVPD